MLSVPEPQIRALIRLLSDGDERIARTIAGKLAEIGEPAVPLLREAELEQPEMAARISEVLDDIQGQRLEGDFHALSARDDEDRDLETGAGHFLVKYEADRYRIFVDCFNGGTLLTQKDCARFLDQAGYGFDERYLQKTPPRTILIRMIKNLVAIYNKMEDVSKATQLTRFIEILGLPEKEE